MIEWVESQIDMWKISIDKNITLKIEVAPEFWKFTLTSISWSYQRHTGETLGVMLDIYVARNIFLHSPESNIW